MGYLFAVINQFVSPADIITFPEDTNPYTASSVKAGGFALITAVALFAGMIPTGNEELDKSIDSFARFLGVVSAFGAGWYSLDSANHGQSGSYLYGLITLTSFALLVILFAGGYIAISRLVSGALVAVLLSVNAALIYLMRVRTFRLRRTTGTND